MKKPKRSPGPSEKPRNRALRLVFEYDGTDIKLISQQRLAMLAPPPHPLVSRENERGFWVLLSDAEGRPLYRRVMDNPIRQDIEVVADDPDRPLARVRVAEPRGQFFVVVPDIPASRSIALFGEAVSVDVKPAPSRELCRFKLATSNKEDTDHGHC